MQKRVFIVHGWGGFPKEGWFPWLKNSLEKKGFKVFVPSMPDSDNPKIKSWVSHLAKIVKKPNKNTYFVGHSIGCQTILRYLETIDEKAGGAIFVSPWFSLKGLSREEMKIAKPWLTRKIDIKKITKTNKKYVSIFSDNDPCVPLNNIKIFEDKLNSDIIVMHNKGHFSGEDKVKTIPILLKELLNISKR